MGDSKRLRDFMATHGVTPWDVATLWDGHADDVLAVLDGDGSMSPRHIALLVLFGGSHKAARASALRQLRRAFSGPEWRPIPGFNKYEASSEGQIRRAVGGSGASPLRVLKLTPRPDGYLRVTLYADDGRMHTKQVHRMVCAAFHGPKWDRHACHRDGEKTNNAATNLYWGTPLDNARDRVTHARANPERALQQLAERGGKAGSRLGKASVRKLYKAGLISKDKALSVLAQ
jgi:hypothetical protein